MIIFYYRPQKVDEIQTYFSGCLRLTFRANFEVMHAFIKALEGKKTVIFGSYLERAEA